MQVAAARITGVEVQLDGSWLWAMAVLSSGSAWSAYTLLDRLPIALAVCLGTGVALGLSLSLLLHDDDRIRGRGAHRRGAVGIRRVPDAPATSALTAAAQPPSRVLSSGWRRGVPPRRRRAVLSAAVPQPIIRVARTARAVPSLPVAERCP